MQKLCTLLLILSLLLFFSRIPHTSRKHEINKLRLPSRAPVKHSSIIVIALGSTKVGVDHKLTGRKNAYSKATQM
jgi:hypothetical protein